MLLHCNKPDIKIEGNAEPGKVQNALVRKFFSNNGNISPEVIAVIENIRKQEGQKPFVEEWVTFAGFPDWDRSLTLSNQRNVSGTLTKGTEDNAAETVIIPFSFKGDTTLNAILKVRLSRRDTTFQMLYKWQYKQNGYKHDGSVNNAHQTALFFMGFESYLFQHHTFKLKDTLLLKGNRVSDLITIKSFQLKTDAAARMQSITYNTCYQVPCSNFVSKTTSTLYCEQCESYTIWYDDGESQENPGIPGGMTSGGDGGWSENPCNPSTPPPAGGNNNRVVVSNDCNSEPGWEAAEDLPALPTFPNNIPPSEADLIVAIKDRPFAFFQDVPCEVLKAWLQTAKHTISQDLLDRMNTIVWSSAHASPGTGAPGFQDKHVVRVQKLDDAYSTVVNMDYFPVTVTQLPTANGVSWSPDKFLDYIRKNINNSVDRKYSSFKPFNWNGINDAPLWNSSNPMGSIINIDIKGPDNGSVIVSDYSNNKWTFTTIYDPVYGEHPVSGNSDFGYTYNADGSYTFYTRGVDRLTSKEGSLLQDFSDLTKNIIPGPFTFADDLWKSFQLKIANFVNDNLGVAVHNPEQILCPNFQLLKDVVEGRAPLSVLSKDCL